MISSEYIQTAMQDWNVPGLSIAVVKDGKILLTAGFGQCNVDRPAPVNERSLFTIGSCTKAFATTALAILVEEKLLSWEDPLRKFIPGFSLPSDSEGSALTLAEIVSHQSGVEDGAITDLPCATLDEALAHLRQIKAQGKRGVGMTYNNTLFASLALVIEKTTGMPWSDFMHERIFQPLAMNDSFSMEADRYKGNEHKCNQAFPHRHIWQTQQTVVMTVKSLDYLAASAAVQTCAADMAKWLNFQLGYQPTILNSQALMQMHRLKYHVEVNQFTLMMHPGSSIHGYGQAWYVRDYLGRMLVQHGGYVDGFTAFNLLCPETNLGVAVLTNMHNSLLPFALAYRVVDADFGQPEFDWSGHFLQKRAEHRRMVSPHAEENARIAQDHEQEQSNTISINNMDNQIFQLTRESAPQANCHLAVEARLNEISRQLSHPESVCIFILGLLLQGIEAEESPIFIFPKANFEEAKALILSWVNNEQNKHYLLPPLVIHFAWAVSADLDEILQSPAEFGDDAILVQNKIELWKQQSEES